MNGSLEYDLIPVRFSSIKAAVAAVGDHTEIDYRISFKDPTDISWLTLPVLSPRRADDARELRLALERITEFSPQRGDEIVVWLPQEFGVVPPIGT